MTGADIRPHLNRAHVLDLLSRMIRVRHFEDKCAELYTQQKIRGFLHLYDGEEAVAAGVIPLLGADDRLVATYREHGHALVRGVPMNAVMAEMYGKANGCAGGRGGSMHLFSRDHNFYGGNAIVGGGLPLAIGLGLGDKMNQESRVTACFFGDGAVAEGEFHESLNLAALWDLPVLFVCENNGYAMGTALKYIEAETDIQAVGDFCVFTAREPVTILAGESAIIPVFNHQLKDAEEVLHFKASNNAERGFRCISFTNDTDFTLGRGPCTYTKVGVHQGDADFPACKPGEDHLVPFALDSGVRFLVTPGRREESMLSIAYTKGKRVQKVRTRQSATYRVNNVTEEATKVFLDHDRLISHSDISVEVGGEKKDFELTKTGCRVEFEVPAKSEVVVTTKEVYESSSTNQITSYNNANWLITEIKNKSELENDEGVRRCLQIQQQVNEATAALSELDERHSKLQQRSNRLRQNIGSGQSQDDTVKDWRKQLAEAESQLQDIEDNKRPAAVKSQQDLIKELQSAFESLEAEWNNPTS